MGFYGGNGEPSILLWCYLQLFTSRDFRHTHIGWVDTYGTQHWWHTSRSWPKLRRHTVEIPSWWTASSRTQAPGGSRVSSKTLQWIYSKWLQQIKWNKELGYGPIWCDMILIGKFGTWASKDGRTSAIPFMLPLAGKPLVLPTLYVVGQGLAVFRVWGSVQACFLPSDVTWCNYLILFVYLYLFVLEEIRVIPGKRNPKLWSLDHRNPSPVSGISPGRKSQVRDDQRSVVQNLGQLLCYLIASWVNLG